MNRADLLYEALKDGRARTRSEIFADTGRFFLTNNAASELRARGYVVEHIKEGRLDVYRLLGQAAGDDAAGRLSERVGTDGERRQSARSLSGDRSADRGHGHAAGNGSCPSASPELISAPGGGTSLPLSAAPSAADDDLRMGVVPEPSSFVPGQLSIDEVAA